MIPVSKSRIFATLTAVAVALAACGSTEDDGVRTGPQAVHPSPSKLAQQGLTAKASAPSVAAQSDLSVPINAFRQTCLTHAPNISALAKAAPKAGFGKVERNGKSLFSARFGGTTPLSFQVNVNTKYSHECAVTVVLNERNRANVRETFFKAVNVPHRNGVGKIAVNGQAYILKHLTFGGGGLGVTEHAFLLQK
jgi:hypothetical protein